MNSTDAPDGAASVVTNIKNWATMPFSTQMDFTHWALFTGLIICLTIFWLMVLHETLGEV